MWIPGKGLSTDDFTAWQEHIQEVSNHSSTKEEAGVKLSGPDSDLPTNPPLRCQQHPNRDAEEPADLPPDTSLVLQCPNTATPAEQTLASGNKPHPNHHI